MKFGLLKSVEFWGNGGNFYLKINGFLRFSSTIEAFFEISVKMNTDSESEEKNTSD